MSKSSHFSGQPPYGQVIKLLDKSKILDFSRKNGGERYTKRFNGWIHLVVMLYAVIMRFDSLREITTSLLAETIAPVYAYLYVAAFYLVLVILLLVFRRRLLLNPISRFITRLLLRNPEGDN